MVIGGFKIFHLFFHYIIYKLKEKIKKFLDACAAPGGKSFQILSKNLMLF